MKHGARELKTDSERAGRAPAVGSAGRAAGAARFAALCLAVLVLDLALLSLLFTESLAAPAAVAGHITLVGLAVLWPRSRRNGNGDPRLAWLLPLTTLVMGPLGAAGTLLTLVVCARKRVASGDFEEWYEALVPAEVSLQRADFEMPGRLTAESQAEPVPFVAILSSGSHEEKLEVIVRMTRRFRPAFAPALRLALNDASNFIRVQAATAITHIEDAFSSRAQELADASARDPQDPQALLALARHYDEHAYTGLLDTDRERENRRRALEAFQGYLQLRPDSPAERTAVGRLLVRQGHFAEAAGWFEDCQARGISGAQVLLWYMECLSRLGRFQELRRLAGSQLAACQSEEGCPPEVTSAVALWASGGAEAARAAP